MKLIHTRSFLPVVLIILIIAMLFGCTGDKNTTYITSYDVPGVPTDIQAVAGDGEVTVRWSPVAGATSYNIYWNTAGGVARTDEVIGTSTTLFVHPYLANGTTYYYSVSAVNVEGESGLSSEASATPVDSSISNPPSAPAAVTATGGDGQVTINWSPVSGATSYNIYWDTSGSITTADSAIISAPSPYVHMNLTNGTTYHYAVTAINNDGESGLSTEASATPAASGGTGTPPSAPANVQATAGDGQVAVTWSPVSGATSYNIYWNTTGSVTTSDDVIGTSASLLLHPNLTNGIIYYYAVTAVNAEGESNLSTEVSATPLAGAGGAGSPPSAPTNVQATGDDGQVTISWSPVDGATAYNIYWNTTGSVATSDDAIGTSTTLFVHPDLTNGTTYYYVVTANNAYGESSASVEVSAMPGLPFQQMLQKISAGDIQPSDRFGWSVSISGDYAIVGSDREDGGIGDPVTNAGAAYIYHRIGPDSWDTGTKIVATDPQAGDQFGYSVSIDGDYAIVGANYEDGGAGDPLSQAGAAYIFHRTGTNTWDAGIKIVATDPQVNDNYGSSVSISGDYAIVGAFLEDGGPGNPVTNAGAAYIYHRTGTNTWDGGTKIVATDPQAGDEFGYSVSISGNYAIVGAIYEAGGPGDPLPLAGAAYAFRRTGTNTWDAGTKIVAPDAQASDLFGWSVSISGDYAIVGADNESGGAGDPVPNAGAAYIYRRTGTNTWDAGTKIVATDPQAGDQFGYSVSISGDYAIVGAVYENGGTGDPLNSAGAAYIFHRTGTNTWDAGIKIIATDPQTNDYYGLSVSISGDYAIVGAYSEDGGAGDPLIDAGVAYIYE